MDLFDDVPAHPDAATTPIGQSAELLHGFARNDASAFLKAAESVL